MSRAFDTISRQRLLDILLNDVGLAEDEMRICQSLLANTNLKVKIQEFLSDPFETTVGTPQGDGLSPILFVVYLESALREVRKRTIQQGISRPQDDNGIPEETIYADDCDFFSSSEPYLKSLEEIIPPTIEEFDLMANPSKWERTKLMCEEEAWKSVRKLGSLLGDEEDMDRRMSLASAQFKQLTKLWEKSSKTAVETRMRVYNSFILPILLYNSNTWGVTDAAIHKLETFHRRQLRTVLGIFYPFTISNKELYKRCKATPIGSILRESRWRLFGHVLRLPVDAPAQIAMDFYCSQKESIQKGRPQTTLPVVLFNEFHTLKQSEKQSTYRQKPTVAIRELRKLASDRTKWKNLVLQVCRVLTSD